ncbi:M20/M25/M40 family metallo-hydrolase [Deinococcus alpinitundrae]|uniref:M20/M25/M40 family metallo-hydrolase n=1 Tax=Deinococcus alpinitundrae TaxID=468913 RepID=UPI001379F1F6|nr:M20/M25/M40 family metallo-hydrolase [Deinococcus alpinitundrae]
MTDTPAELLAALIRIDSTNPSLVPGGAGETQLAHFVADWLRAHGVAAELDEAGPGRPSVIARVSGRGGGRTLLLNAHLDTVGTASMPDALMPRTENGRMYGRGSYDMKGGLAACLLALVDAAQANLRGEVILMAVADEEYASLGTLSVLRRMSADAAIVTEPTSLKLCVAHKGFTWHQIKTFGIAAHGSRPDLGQDAVAQMGWVLGQLEGLQRSLEARPAHPLLGHASVHASRIEGGQELSSYPAECTLQLERRTLPGETLEAVCAEWDDILRHLTAPNFRAEHQLLLARAAFSVPEDAPIVQSLRLQAERVLGYPPELTGLGFWMDSALLAEAGIPTVVFGPHGAGAHGAEEWVDLKSVEQCRDVLSATIRDFCD